MNANHKMGCPKHGGMAFGPNASCTCRLKVWVEIEHHKIKGNWMAIARREDGANFVVTAPTALEASSGARAQAQGGVYVSGVGGLTKEMANARAHYSAARSRANAILTGKE